MRGEQVSRPHRKNDFRIEFASRQAAEGWKKLEANRRNLLVTVWEFLTANPQAISPLCYPLKGELAEVVRNGQSHQRWQIKLSLADGARIWYWVDGSTVFLENVHTHHPNATKR